jgi:N-methylhydantoinase B
MVGREAAKEEYGVILDDTGNPDSDATEKQREDLLSRRDGDLPQFDHGDPPPLEEQRERVAASRRHFDEWLSGELGGS